MGVLFADQVCIDPAELAAECDRVGVPYGEWRGRANRFVCHRDEPGDGDILLSRRQLEAIDQTKSHEMVFTDKVSGCRVTLKRVHITVAVCATPGKPGDDNAIYHVRLSDIRRLWKLYPYDKGINCPLTPGDDLYSDDTSNGGTAWTWAEAWADLWDALPSGNDEGAPKGAMPTLPASVTGSPLDLRYWGWTVADAIEDFLRRLGLALCYDPVDDTFSLGEFGTEQDGLAEEMDNQLGKRLHDAEPILPGLGRYPNKVRVLFPKRPEATWGRDPWYAVEVDAPAPIPKGTMTTAVALLFDDMAAVTDAGECTNVAALTTQAQSRSTTYFERVRAGEQYRQMVYSTALATMLPGSQVSSVVWEDRGDALKTEVVHRPIAPKRTDTWKSNATDERWNMLEHVWVYTSVSGVTPPTGYKPGQVDEWSTEDGTWYKGFDCWWKEHNGQTEVAGRHLGRFVGQLDGRPVYAGGCCPDGTGTDNPGTVRPNPFPSSLSCIPSGTPYRDNCSVFIPNPEMIALEVTISSTAGTCSDLPTTAANVTCNVLGTFPLISNGSVNGRPWADDPGGDYDCGRHCFWQMTAGEGTEGETCEFKGYSMSLYYVPEDQTFAIRSCYPPTGPLYYGGPPAIGGIIPLSYSPLHIQFSYFSNITACGGPGVVTIEIVEA